MVINEEPITAPGSESDREAVEFERRRLPMQRLAAAINRDETEYERLEREAAEGLRVLQQRKAEAWGFIRNLWDAIGDKGEIHPNNDAPEGIYEFSFIATQNGVLFTLWFDSEWNYRIRSDSGNSMHGGGGTLREWMNPASVDRFAEMLLQLASSDAM